MALATNHILVFIYRILPMQQPIFIYRIHPMQLPKNSVPMMVEMAVSTALIITDHWVFLSLFIVIDV